MWSIQRIYTYFYIMKILNIVIVTFLLACVSLKGKAQANTHVVSIDSTIIATDSLNYECIHEAGSELGKFNRQFVSGIGLQVTGLVLMLFNANFSSGDSQPLMLTGAFVGILGEVVSIVAHVHARNAGRSLMQVKRVFKKN